MAELGESSTSSSTRDVVITMDKTRDIIRDIGRYLTDEKLYKPEQAAEVFKLEPSESFGKIFERPPSETQKKEEQRQVSKGVLWQYKRSLA